VKKALPMLPDWSIPLLPALFLQSQSGNRRNGMLKTGAVFNEGKLGRQRQIHTRFPGIRKTGRKSSGCCPNPFSLGLKRFLINLRLAPGDLKTRPSGSNSSNRFWATACPGLTRNKKEGKKSL
jgi:hypothetical protein